MAVKETREYDIWYDVDIRHATTWHVVVRAVQGSMACRQTARSVEEGGRGLGQKTVRSIRVSRLA